MRNSLELGKWNVICDRCGLQFKNDALRSEWTGLKVCGGCWEPRHPQTLIGAPRAESAPAWTRSEPPETFIQLPSYFSWSPTAPERDQVVTFTDASPDSPTEWSWNFGDSGTSTSQNPTHTFTTAGTFSVSLSTDVTTSTSHSVTITAPTLKWDAAVSIRDGVGTLTNGDKTATFTSGTQYMMRGIVPMPTGGNKFYWEITTSGGGNFDAATPGMGIVNSSYNMNQPVSGGMANMWNIQGNGKIYNQTSGGGTYTAPYAGGTFMFALDTTTGKWWCGKDGTWFNSGNPTAGTGNLGTCSGSAWYPFWRMGSGFSGSGTIRGSDTLVNSVPSGFTALGK